jgi:hypothetical protein
MQVKSPTILMISVAILIPTIFCVCTSKLRDTAETRLQRLEDRESIRRLLMEYGKFLDRRDFTAFSGLFAEKDGEWIGGMGKAKGSQAIRALMEKSIGTGNPIQGANLHLFSNEIISIAGDRASASTKWIFVTTGDGNRPQPVYLGHYDDEFIRENGNWKFLRRTVASDIPSDDQIRDGRK